MSRRDSMKRIFVGNLPPDVRTKEIDDLFYKFGKIAFIDLKTRRGPPFAFVEFHDYRDAEEAVRRRDGMEYEGARLRVEFPRGRERVSRFKNGSGSGSRSNPPQRRSKYRVKVTGLPASGSWQDLKDHMRDAGEVCFADVYKGGEGVVEFVTYNDMRYAIKKFDNNRFKSHEGESSYIRLKEDIRTGDSRSRSRSPAFKKRRGGHSPYASPERRSTHSLSSSRSPTRHRRGGDHHKHSSKRRSNSRSRSASRSRSHSDRSRASSGTSSGRGRSRSRSKSPRNDRRDKSPARSNRSDSRSPRAGGVKTESGGSKNERDSRSRSRSKSHSSRSAGHSPNDSKRTNSKSPSRTPTPERNGSPAKA